MKRQDKVNELAKSIWDKVMELDYDPMNVLFEHLDAETKSELIEISEKMITKIN